MTAWITDTIRSLGYPGVALLMFLENVCPPIPSELIMPFAGVVAARGGLSFVGVVIAGVLGAVAGALVLYYLGRSIGEDRLKRWADRHGCWMAVSSRDIENARCWFDRHGTLVVFICRLVPGVRSLVSIPAGTNRMSLPVFLFYTSLGATLWTSLLVYLGHVLGSNYHLVQEYLDPVSYIVLGGLIVWFLVRVVRLARLRRSVER